MADNLQDLKRALAFSVSVIAAEHVFSAGMSSPWSVAKFAQTDEDRAQVWRLFTYSVISSAAFSLAVGLMMGDNVALALGLSGVAAISIFMFWEYNNALGGTL